MRGFIAIGSFVVALAALFFQILSFRRGRRD